MITTLNSWVEASVIAFTRQRLVFAGVDSANKARTDGSRLPWETENLYGGFGGSDYFNTKSGVENTPIVFLHGNTGSANDWADLHQFFLENGYTGDELWSITFGKRTPTHEEMVPQIDHFISNVLDYTGAEEVILISHSLGVTGARYWLYKTGKHELVDKFIGIAGGNHGTRLCTVLCESGLDKGKGKPSQFLRHDYESFETHPLKKLNENETPGDIDYYTIRGTADKMFLRRPESPRLEGAIENAVIDGTHMSILDSQDTKEKITQWLHIS